MTKEMAKEKGLKPLATVRHAATIGVDPTIMGIGPAPATQKLLKRTGMSMDDFDLIEINEAFACQVLAVGEELKWDWDKVNPNGGAVAIGHPLGASGARLVGTIAYEMNRRDAEWAWSRLHGCGDGDVRGATARALRLVSVPVNLTCRRAKPAATIAAGFRALCGLGLARDVFEGRKRRTLRCCARS
jgi:acetyl-CoA acetyltransferase